LLPHNITIDTTINFFIFLLLNKKSHNHVNGLEYALVFFI
jgi:hypothetical protein